MKHRSAALALAVALVLPIAGGTAASAATLTHPAAKKSGHHEHPETTKPTKDKKDKAKTVVYAGTVSAVDAGAATLTLSVRGHKGHGKKARTTSLTLTVPAGITITRNGSAVTLDALQAGDRVKVQTKQTSTATTVTRIIAKGVAATPTTDPTPDDDVTPEPTPTS